MKHYIIALLLILTTSTTEAQNAYTIKGGLTLGTQNWNGLSREPLFSYHTTAVYETIRSETASYFVELGYHRKGSAIRIRNYVNPITGNTVQGRTIAQAFENIVLGVGVKNTFGSFDNLRPYYMLGLRLDYNLKNTMTYNYEDFVNKFTYGVMLGGGIELDLGGSTQFIIEVQANPDISNQVYVQPGFYYNRFTQQNQQTGEQRVRNTALELAIGFRFTPSSYLSFEE